MTGLIQRAIALLCLQEYQLSHQDIYQVWKIETNNGSENRKSSRREEALQQLREGICVAWKDFEQGRRLQRTFSYSLIAFRKKIMATMKQYFTQVSESN